MARTIQEIYDAIITEKETFSSLDTLVPNPDDAQTFLQDLTSTSRVAIWRLYFWVCAVAIHAHEVIFDSHSAAVEARGNELIPGTALWLQGQCLLFQLGDQLQFIDNKFQYPAIDEDAQIVERASVTEVGGQVIIKVAKLDGSGVPEALSVSELNAFNTYINQIKFAGQQTVVVSRDADELRIFYKVVYDPQVIATDGSLVDDPATFPVEDAINSFIQNLPFDGTLNITQLTDAIQAVTGVIDPIYQSSEARFGTNPFAAFTENYVAQAGHMTIDPGTPLSTSLTYQAG